MAELTAYASLFGVAFLAATVVPFYSEALFLSLLAAGYAPLGLWASASLGNTLGAATNWLLGRYLLHLENRAWFPFNRDRLHRAQAFFNRYGRWTLLLAWAPVGGDALTFIAGLMRVPFWLFLLLAGAGKAARYWALTWLG